MVNFPGGTMRYQPGSEIAGYRVLSCIGGGSYGFLYLVRDVTGALYALKILHQGSTRELEALQKLRQIPPCPGLTHIHAAGSLPEGNIYYLMDAADNLQSKEEYLPDTLANRMARNGCLGAPELLTLAASLLPALQYLHEHGAVHCDIKPENIIFIRQVPVLADFGSLALFDTAEGVPAVTPGFFPPEELSGGVNGRFSPKNDLYALGMTLYCAWSGHDPEDYPRLPEEPDAAGLRVIRKLLLRACNPRPAYRFQSAKDFLKAVRRAENALKAPARRRKRIIWGWIIALLCAMLFAFVFLQRQATCRQQEFQKNWKIVKAKVTLAKMAEEDRILVELKAAEGAVDRETWKKLKIPEAVPQFQLLHDLLAAYTKWEKTPEPERGKIAEQLIAMAGRCPKGYRNPLIPLQSFLLTHRELSPDDAEFLKYAESVCGRRYNQLKLELAALRKNPRLRESRLKAKEKQLQEFKQKYALETECIDIFRKLRFAGEVREIAALRARLETLKQEWKRR